MSQKNALIIAMQDNTVLENTLVIWLYFSIVMLFVFLAAVFILRKELLKSLTYDSYTPNSRVPKTLRNAILILASLSTVAAVSSGILFFKIQDVRNMLKEQSIILENTTRDETQEIIQREALAPITKEEFAQIDRDVKEEISNSMRLLEIEAQNRAENDPTTTVEKELHKLMNGLKAEVDKAQGREPTTIEMDNNKTSKENLDAVVNAIFMEPVKQVKEAEQLKKNNERVVSEQ